MTDSTAGYAREAPNLLERYEKIFVEDLHKPVWHLIPTTPSRTIVPKQKVMHLPETVVSSGELRSLSRRFRVRMSLGQWKMPIHIPDLIAELSE